MSKTDSPQITPDTVTVCDVKYVRADRIQASDSPIRIVVLQGRWNVVGRYREDGDEGIVDDASVIRQWGTKKGLGEIAANGPTLSTILDKCNGQVRFHLGAKVLTIDCEASKWSL